jgi:zinc transporter
MAPEVDQGNGLLFAYVLDGQGGGRELDWEGIRAWSPEDGVLWVHLDRTGEQARAWVSDETGIDKATTETLLMPAATRPRVQRIGDGLLVVLRGLNFNPATPRTTWSNFTCGSTRTASSRCAAGG